MQVRYLVPVALVSSAVLVCGVSAAACSVSASHPPVEETTLDGSDHTIVNHDPDGGLSDAEAGGALEDTMGQCNDLQASRTRADVNFVGPGSAPTPAGGTIVDGLYSLSTYLVYALNPAGNTGIGGLYFKESFRYTGARFDVVNESDSTPRSRKSGTWAAVDADGAPSTSLDLHFACPSTSDFRAGYTATPTKIDLFLPGPTGGVAVASYALQP